MNKSITYAFGLISVLALGFGVAAYIEKPVEITKTIVGEKGEKGDRGPQGERGPAGKDAEVKLGAAAGPDFYNEIFLFDNMTVGGKVNSVATTATAYTLSAAELNARIINVTPNGASLTLTLPGTSTLGSFVPQVGQTKEVFIRNATTTANVNITIAGGTGTTLKRFATTSPAVITGDTDAANYGMLTFIRRSVGNIDVLFEAVVD